MVLRKEFCALLVETTPKKEKLRLKPETTICALVFTLDKCFDTSIDNLDPVDVRQDNVSDKHGCVVK